jgi:hypothetical protein
VRVATMSPPDQISVLRLSFLQIGVRLGLCRANCI